MAGGFTRATRHGFAILSEENSGDMGRENSAPTKDTSASESLHNPPWRTTPFKRGRCMESEKNL
jgi:hypothetical protein